MKLFDNSSSDGVDIFKCDKSVLVESLDDVKHKWFEIGAFLGVPVGELEIIDDCQDSMKTMGDKLKHLIEVSFFRVG